MTQTQTAPEPAAEGPATRSDAGGGAGGRARLVGALPFLVLVALTLVITVQQPSFFSVPSIRGLLESMTPILLLAIGQTFVILTGGIDLSFAVTASFSTVLLAMWLPGLGVLAVVGVLAVTALIGFVNGLVIAKAQIPSFIATLGALGLYSGLGLAISGASTIRIRDGYDAIGWITDLRVAQLPLAAVLTIVLAVAVAVGMRTLAHGRDLHALGLAEQALLMSGALPSASGCSPSPSAASARGWPGSCSPPASTAAGRPSPTPCSCPPSRPSSSAARRSPAGSAARSRPRSAR